MNFYQNSNQNRSYFSQAALNSIHQSPLLYQQENPINQQVIHQQPQNFLGFNQSSKMNISHSFINDPQKMINSSTPQFPSLLPGQQVGQPMNLMNFMNQGYSQPIFIKGPIVRHSPAQMFLQNFSSEQSQRNTPSNLKYPQEDIKKVEQLRQYPQEILNKEEFHKTKEEIINYQDQVKKHTPKPIKKITEDQSESESESDIQSSEYSSDDDEEIPQQKIKQKKKDIQKSTQPQAPIINPAPKITTPINIPIVPQNNKSKSISIQPQTLNNQSQNIKISKEVQIQSLSHQKQPFPIENQFQPKSREITIQNQFQPKTREISIHNQSNQRDISIQNMQKSIQIVQDIPIQKPIQNKQSPQVIQQQQNTLQDLQQKEIFQVKRQRQVPFKNQVYYINGKQVTKVQKNLRLFYIRFLFINLYFRGLRKLILAKKQRFELLYQESLAKAIQMGTEWAMTFLEEHLMPFWQTNDKFDWLAENDLKNVEVTGRIRRSKMFIDSIIDILFEYMKESNFDKTLLKFLAEISQNYQFAPQNFFFAFEVKRFKFTTYGALKGMTSDHQKMVIALFLVIRIVLFTILYAPWQLGLDMIKETETLRENSLIVTSIIHELVVQEFRDLIIIKNNQDQVLKEHKVFPRQGPLKYDPDSKDPEERQYVKSLVEPLIFPLYDAEEMSQLFEKEPDVIILLNLQKKKKKKWVNAMRGKLDDLYDRMLKIVKEVYQNERKKQTKVKIVEKIKLLKRI